MNALVFVFLVLCCIGVFALPRRYALLPLLLSACYTTNANSIDLGPLHFTVLRIVVLMGFIRTMMRNEKLAGGYTGMDKLMLWWGAIYFLSSAFHSPFKEALVYRLGTVYNAVGVYFLLRLFIQNKDDLIQVIKITALVLVPVALEMVNEKLTGRNFFGLLGGVPLETMVREGRLRAQGPFGHPILAGTVGGLCIPLMIVIWRENRKASLIGIGACLAMVWASGSSTPIMTTLFGILGLVLWRFRQYTRQMRIGLVVTYIVCDIFMTRPAYFLLEKVDLTGNSTGYHRAAIIDAAVKHFGEWWVGGTDYTRHWMPYGVSFSENHSDITNHYLFYGIHGGIPLMLLFILMIRLGFKFVGQMLNLTQTKLVQEQFFIWSLGAFLFAHTVTMVTVAYFDQSSMFLFLCLAAITSLFATIPKPSPAAAY